MYKIFLVTAINFKEEIDYLHKLACKQAAGINAICCKYLS